jgi:RNA polymerase sigma factor (sigma-70 family)
MLEQTLSKGVQLKNRGIAKSEFGAMNTREIDHPMEADALREVERAIRGRLKAYGLSRAFIDRAAEDAMQKGWEEYLRACGNGRAIENPGGFIVRAGFLRAIDELRREGRRADGVVLDAVIDRGGATTASEPSTEEAAIAYVRAGELRDAVGQLSAEEQRVLSLHYFEELSAEASAAALFCSERTYRRRLKRALRRLCRVLGAPVPEPGSDLAIEVGLAAWVGLRGADVALAHGLPQAFLGILERGRDGADWVLDRLRGPASRLGMGGGSERISAIASGPIGKVAGGCAGAAAVCILGGAISAGVGGPGAFFGHRDSRPPHLARRASNHAARVAGKPQVRSPDSQPTTSPPQPTAIREEPSAAQRRRLARRAEQRQLKEQFSATARIESESSPAGSASAASAPAAESVTVTPSSGSSTSSQASEEAQAEKQFGAFR